MPDTDPDVLVLNGDDRPPAPGAAAVFQGMLSVLGEELESLHQGMAALARGVAESRAESRAEAGAAAAAVAEQLEGALDRRLAELSARLTAQQPPAQLHETVSAMDGRLADLETLLAQRAGENGAAEALQRVEATVLQAMFSLEERLAVPAPDAGAELRGLLAEVSQRLDALENSTLGTLDGVSERLERLARVGDGVAMLQESVNRSRGETMAAVEGLGATMAERVATIESEVARHVGELAELVSTLEEPGRQEGVDIEFAVRRGLGALEARIGKLEESVSDSSSAWSSSARALTEAVAGLVAKAVGDVADRVAEVERRVDVENHGAVEQAVAAAEAARSQWAMVESRLVQLEAASGEGRAEATSVAARLERAAVATREHLAGLEAGLQAIHDGPPLAVRGVVENLSPAIEDVNDRVARVEQGLARLVDQADLRSTTLASDLQGVLAAGMERLVALAARAEESTAAELQGTRTRVEAIATSLADLATEVTGVADVGRRLADEGRARPVLEAIDTAARENGEVLAALHASITRRIDARVRSIGEMVEGLAAPLGATAALAPQLEEVGRAISAQQADVERIQGMAEQVATAIGAVPGGLAAALVRQDAVLEQVQTATAERKEDTAALKEAFAGLESSIGRSLEGVRSYLGDGLKHVSRRQAGTGRAMESAAAALQSMERQLNDLAGLCQSLASGVEQHTGASARVADLVLETRSSLRSDVDRLEATVHLEALKLHQQDQARLAGTASTTTEVVEREAAVLAQRISAVAAAVDSVRTVLHAHVEDASREGSAPLALVRDS